MANKNTVLNAAAQAKKDEFYTQLSDIEKEMRHYRKHFKGKTVFCNCDDPFESNFFKYFVLNFNKLGLKKLICTCYAGSPIAYQQLSLFDIGDQGRENTPYKAIIKTVYDKTGDGMLDMEDIKELFKSRENELTELEGNGDFASSECLELMDESDIVVTNPPFSLFRKYVTTLIERKKKFIIVGHQNAIKYKEVFPYIMENKLWLGYGFDGNAGYFYSPYEDIATASNHKEGFIRVSGVTWFTNLDIKKRHEEMILVKRYNDEDYPHYTNLDAIDVSNSADIPCDYPGMMGVPITFLEKFNPDQFELLGTSTGDMGKAVGITKNHRGRTDVAYIGKDGKPHCPYQRLIIRNKHPEPPKEI